MKLIANQTQQSHNFIKIYGIARRSYGQIRCLKFLSSYQIGDSAFDHNKIETVILHQGLKTIGPRAFMHNHIKDIAIPESVSFISFFALHDNPISSIQIGSEVILRSITQNGFDEAYKNANSSNGHYQLINGSWIKN